MGKNEVDGRWSGRIAILPKYHREVGDPKYTLAGRSRAQDDADATIRGALGGLTQRPVDTRGPIAEQRGTAEGIARDSNPITDGTSRAAQAGLEAADQLYF